MTCSAFLKSTGKNTVSDLSCRRRFAKNSFIPLRPSNVLRHSAFALLLAILLAASAATAQVVVATVPVGSAPVQVTVNPTTNMVYVANFLSSDVTVINGATYSTTTVKDPNASGPYDVAVNSVTNMIYVPNFDSGNVTVIDGATNATTTVRDPNAGCPAFAAVNSQTNKIYVTNWCSANVTVIDGTTNSTTTVDVGDGPLYLAVNEVTNTIYVSNQRGGNVTVINGATNGTTTVTDPNAEPDTGGIAVDTLTNNIYVANSGSNNVTVIDGATNATTTVTAPNTVNPSWVAINQTTDTIYINNGGSGPYTGSNNVTVINGATNATTVVPTGTGPNWVAVDTGLNLVYVPNWWSNSVTVINGATNGTITLTDPEANEPNAVAVNGTTHVAYVANGGGYPFTGSNNVTVISSNAAPAVTLSVSSLSFGDQAVDTTSFPKPVTVTNSGTATLDFTSISITAGSADFVIGSNTCGTAIAAGKYCKVTVSFIPTAPGAITGTLSFSDNASNSPQTVSLSGTGEAQATLTPSSLTFGTTLVGATSNPIKVTLKNNLPWTLTGVRSSTSGPFAVSTSTCGTTLASRKSCTISVTFSPTQGGTATGTLTVGDNANNSPQTTSLTGTGSSEPVYVSPPSLAFGDQSVGTTSSPLRISLFNESSDQVTVTSVTASGDFTVTTNYCTDGVKPDSHCDVYVVFSPTQSGPLSGTLTFVDNATGSPQTASLSGTGD
jgi:YVTN family beta-propeller protein